METEIWKPVVGYEGLYEVSSLGMVRSVDRKEVFHHKDGKQIERFRHGKTMTPNYDGKGCYLHVRLTKNGIGKSTNVHRIVATAFIPNPNNLPEVNHIDEDKTNNAVSNLEWCDHLYNNRYGTKLTSSRGEKNSMNKFSENTVRAIRSEYDPSVHGGTLTSLSKKYGVSVSHVKSIVTGFRWGWLE